MPVCPDCAASAPTLWYRSLAGDFRFLACPACGTLFRDPPLWRIINYSRYGSKDTGGDWAISGSGAEARSDHQHRKLHDGLALAGTELSGKSLLEIGCGPGLLLARMSREYPTSRFWGLDPTDVHAPVEGYTRISSPLEEAELPEAELDVVAMFGNFMLHKSPSQSLWIIRKAMKPGGVLIFDYKNPATNSRLLVRKARALGRFAPRAFARAERQAFHGINFAPTALDDLLSANGFALEHWATSHSLGVIENRGRMARMVRLVDRSGARAWVDVVARAN